MPLQHTFGPHYLKRTRIFIDPDERTTDSKDQFEFVLPLDNLYENVAAIELVNYNIRGSLQTTFVEQQERFPGNNIVDISLTDVATNLQVLDFSVVLSPAGYKNVEEMAKDLTLQFNTQMDAQGHAFFNSSNNVFWTITENTSVNAYNVDHTLDFKIEENLVADTIQATFLFASGTNRDNNASLPLGFTNEDTAVFTVAPTTYYTPQPQFRPELFTFRYVDISIREFPELKPVARVYLTDKEYYSKGNTTVAAVRLLTEPVKEMEEMRVVITLPGGRKPPIEVCSGVDLTFDLIQVSNEVRIPSWTNQLLGY